MGVICLLAVEEDRWYSSSRSPCVMFHGQGKIDEETMGMAKLLCLFLSQEAESMDKRDWACLLPCRSQSYTISQGDGDRLVYLSKAK